MRPDLFLATIGRGSNGSNALEVTEDRAAVTAESQDNIINRVNNISQYGPSWHYVPGIGVAGTAYAEVPGSALGDLAFTRASSKTRTNSAGVVQTIAANVPPHDYRNADGTLSTFPRLNLEPQRTNSIRNSSMVGAVAGTPGTTPTNWVIVNSGLTQTVVGTGTENGLPYIDLRFNGTASGVECRVQFETSTQIAATVGQTWTSTAYAKRIAGTIPTGVGNSLIRQIESNSTGGFVALGGFDISIGNSLSRFAFSRTTTGATTAYIRSEIYFGLTNGQTYDFTIRVAAPQMELGAYATTWVPTTTAAVTRLADTARKTGVSSLIGQTEGAMFAEVNLINIVDGLILQISSSSSNRIGLFYRGSTNDLQIFAVNGGSFTVTINSKRTVGRYKIAAAYKLNDYVFYINGVQVGTDTSSNVPACSTIDLGEYAGFNFSNLIDQAALFPTRLTNAQLAELTTL